MKRIVKCGGCDHRSNAFTANRFVVAISTPSPLNRFLRHSFQSPNLPLNSSAPAVNEQSGLKKVKVSCKADEEEEERKQILQGRK
ncbi:hypothetical protein CEXT_475211 [Caerostris extrusa]|uniref:Uncharacterized protein n=1 Tax=Caerostris extrusa TaxID=172846 RepID=A0AAV4SV40_CAEEX|nr:hypothetical protein CEXT_475211 [Caerostris extrusa]